MERPWRKPGPLSFWIFYFRFAGHECASRRYCCFPNRQTPVPSSRPIGNSAWSLFLIPFGGSIFLPMRQQSLAAVGAVIAQWHVICSLWTEFAKADQGGSRF